MADNLKPCPFCGGEPVVDGKSDDLRIRCEGCDTKGPSFYFDSDDQNDIDTAERDAIEQWNRRAAPPVGDDGLPPLPEPFANFDPRYEGADCPVFTADQYCQGQREAYEAGRRAAVPAQTGTQQLVHRDLAGLNQFISLYCNGDSSLIACAEAAWYRCMMLNYPTGAAPSSPVE